MADNSGELSNDLAKLSNTVTALASDLTLYNNNLKNFLVIRSKTVSYRVNNISYWTVKFTADTVSGYTPIIAFDNGNSGAYHYQAAQAASLPSGSSFTFQYANTQNEAITATITHRYIVLYKKNL